MKLSNMQAMNPQFIPTIEKLLKRSMPVSVCSELVECLKEIEEKLGTLNKVRVALIDKYLAKDEKGQPIVLNGTSPKFIDEEAQKKFMAEVQELLSGDFEVKFDSRIELNETDVMPAQEYMLVRDFIKIIKKVQEPIDISKK